MPASLVAALVVIQTIALASGGSPIGDPLAAASLAPIQTATPQATPMQIAVPGSTNDLTNQYTDVPGGGNRLSSVTRSTVPGNPSGGPEAVPAGSSQNIPSSGTQANHPVNNSLAIATNLNGVFTNYQIMQSNHWSFWH
ncbi:MAG TPA: hypothetical protein VMH30_00920 [Verrucomicrobiae bacterium]|nr:hypothetical protein [Verrucomicrobiae bacterium]